MSDSFFSQTRPFHNIAMSTPDFISVFFPSRHDSHCVLFRWVLFLKNTYGIDVSGPPKDSTRTPLCP